MTTQVVAYTPNELQTAQQTVRSWCAENIRRLLSQKREAQQNVQIALDGKFNSKPFRGQVRRCERRIDYYKKIGKAIKEGYMIVPNFDLELFAVRTNQRAPKAITGGRYAQHIQAGRSLPEGEGRYVSALPVVDEDFAMKENHAGKEYQDWWSWPVEFNEEVTFPVSVIKPHIIAETQKALAKRLFDQIGIARGNVNYGAPRVRYSDPIVCGRICDRTRSDRAVTFFIAWWLDYEDI